MTPRMSEVSRQIAFDSKAADLALTQHQGTDFEQAFLSREIVRQRQLIDVIDNELLPMARGGDQRNEIVRVRPVVVLMLAEASKLEQWLLAQP